MGLEGVNAYLRDDVTFLRTQYANQVVTADSCESVTSTPVINKNKRYVDDDATIKNNTSVTLHP